MKYIAYIGSIVFIVALVLVIIGFKRKDKTNFKRNLVVLVISFIIVGITGKDISVTTTKMQPIINKETKETVKKETHKTVVKEDSLEQLVSKEFKNGKLILDKNSSILTIQFSVDHTNENNFVTQMLYNGENGMEKVYKNDEFKKYQTVRLEGMSDFTDQYGKTTKDVGIKLTFPRSELQKVQSFDNVTNEQFVLLQGENKTYLHPAIKENIKYEILRKVLPNE